jgi:hypothetical protein
MAIILAGYTCIILGNVYSYLRKNIVLAHVFPNMLCDFVVLTELGVRGSLCACLLFWILPDLISPPPPLPGRQIVFELSNFRRDISRMTTPGVSEVRS